MSVEYIGGNEKDLNIEWYISSEFINSDNLIYLGTTIYKPNETEITFSTSTTYNAGDYYLVGKITDIDDNMDNNMAWLAQNIRLKGNTSNTKTDISQTVSTDETHLVPVIITQSPNTVIHNNTNDNNSSSGGGCLLKNSF